MPNSYSILKIQKVLHMFFKWLSNEMQHHIIPIKKNYTSILPNPPKKNKAATFTTIVS
jgi:hypothetical protein